MTTNPADEETFILSDEVLDHINSFFPPPDNHHEKTNQACQAMQALINVIGILLSDIYCVDCWELATKAVEGSLVQMLKDIPVVRADVGAKQRVVCLHCRRITAPRL
jgi:hypothetical protein